jgi:hypothetical protein
MVGAIRPMHASSRDSPQSLEFWEDSRLSGQNRIFEGLLPVRRLHARNYRLRLPGAQ